jgi:hypothetical protein
MQPRRLGGYTIAGKCFLCKFFTSPYFAPINEQELFELWRV